jgi:hypothetical protein
MLQVPDNYVYKPNIITRLIDGSFVYKSRGEDISKFDLEFEKLKKEQDRIEFSLEYLLDKKVTVIGEDIDNFKNKEYYKENKVHISDIAQYYVNCSTFFYNIFCEIQNRYLKDEISLKIKVNLNDLFKDKIENIQARQENLIQRFEKYGGIHEDNIPYLKKIEHIHMENLKCLSLKTLPYNSTNFINVINNVTYDSSDKSASFLSDIIDNLSTSSSNENQSVMSVESIQSSSIGNSSFSEEKSSLNDFSYDMELEGDQMFFNDISFLLEENNS